ncbi:MAG: flagellar basal body P-ring protein FlgI [Candidatus Sericytochromatia bacterium]|nr:flagellar basal body P-ring protein FlgI [Candidatus Sericytochromatia bacterium]
MRLSTRLFVCMNLALGFAGAPQARAEILTQGADVRVKDIASFQGARPNQVAGLGLVVGLQGTGDSQQVRITNRAIENMIQRLNNIPPNELLNSLQTRNAALVTVTATLPAFLKPGQSVDVTVASLGDARAITNGVLLQTPLKATDGKTYVVAQGPISTGGFVSTASGSQTTKNNVVVGRVPNGGLVEREVPVTVVDNTGFMHINLVNPDYATAARMAESINKSALAVAQATDAGTVRCYVTSVYRDRVPELIARIEQLTLRPDHIAKVVIEERSGTVLLGANTRIDPVAISHGGLIVKVDTKTEVSQPPAFSQGRTVVTQNSNISVMEQPAKTLSFESGATLGQLIRALNALGVKPREMISIVQNIKAAGALNAHLEII